MEGGRLRGKDPQRSSTMSVPPSRVRCHHPEDRFTRVKTTDAGVADGAARPRTDNPRLLTVRVSPTEQVK